MAILERPSLRRSHAAAIALVLLSHLAPGGESFSPGLHSGAAAPAAGRLSLKDPSHHHVYRHSRTATAGGGGGGDGTLLERGRSFVAARRRSTPADGCGGRSGKGSGAAASSVSRLTMMATAGRAGKGGGGNTKRKPPSLPQVWCVCSWRCSVLACHGVVFCEVECRCRGDGVYPGFTAVLCLPAVDA